MYIIVELLPNDPVGAIGTELELRCILLDGYFNKYPDGSVSDIKCDTPHDNVTVVVVSNTTALCIVVPLTHSSMSHYCTARNESSSGQIVSIGCKFYITLQKILYINVNFILIKHRVKSVNYLFINFENTDN